MWTEGCKELCVNSENKSVWSMWPGSGAREFIVTKN